MSKPVDTVGTFLNCLDIGWGFLEQGDVEGHYSHQKWRNFEAS